MRLFDAPLRGPQDGIYRAIRERSDREHYRTYLEAMWGQFEPYADPDFPEAIQVSFVPRYWEMYLACSLLRIGKSLLPRPQRRGSAGPDLFVLREGQHAAVEAIAPEGGSGPDAVVEPPMGTAYQVPDEGITLRYASAIDAKRRQHEAWLKQGLVSADDPFVIAVNSGRLPYGMSDIFPPRVCKALFQIGPEYVTIREGEAVGGGYHYRPSLTKTSGTQIPTTVFTDPQSAAVSAVVYSDETINRRYDPRHHYDLSRVGNNLVLIHNPMASAPLPEGWLGVGLELVPRGGRLHPISYPESDVDCEG